MKLKYSLKGLDCANCAQKVQERVSKLENVRECSVVFATTKMFVETDTDLFDESKIVEAVKSVEPDVEVINLSKNGQDYNVSNNHEECNGEHDHKHHHDHEKCGCGHEHEHHHDHKECSCGHDHEHNIESVQHGDLKGAINIKISGLDCANCAMKVEQAINKMNEIDEAMIIFSTETLKVKPKTSIAQNELLKKLQKVVDQVEDDVTLTLKDEIKVVEKKAIGSNNQTSDKIVYLTFDDGPSANTQKILDILDVYGAKATFFVTGNNKPYNHLIKTAHDKGHTIALHTYSHDYKTVYASPEAYFDDLTKVGNMVKDIIGFVPKYVRFPGGSSNTVSRKYCPGIMTVLSRELINRGYQYYDWNGDSTDASGNNVPVSKLIANATSSKANNINILFHDTAAKSTTVQALPAIIENYKARGYRFEAITDSSFVPHQGINN